MKKITLPNQKILILVVGLFVLFCFLFLMTNRKSQREGISKIANYNSDQCNTILDTTNVLYATYDSVINSYGNVKNAYEKVIIAMENINNPPPRSFSDEDIPPPTPKEEYDSAKTILNGAISELQSELQTLLTEKQNLRTTIANYTSNTESTTPTATIAPVSTTTSTTTP